MGFDLGHTISSLAKLALRAKRVIDKNKESNEPITVAASSWQEQHNDLNECASLLEQIRKDKEDETAIERLSELAVKWGLQNPMPIPFNPVMPTDGLGGKEKRDMQADSDKTASDKFQPFWNTMELCDWNSEGDDDKVLEPVIKYLSEQSDSVIFEFDDLMSELLYHLDTKKLADQCQKEDPQMCDDTFLYSRCVALINGRSYYEKVKQGKEKGLWSMEFEALLYVPEKAWALKHQGSVDAYLHSTPFSYETGSNKDGWGGSKLTDRLLRNGIEQKTELTEEMVNMEHDINLNIHYSAPKEVWEKIGKVYASMPYWAGNENEPQWIGENIDLWASVEPSGIQIAGTMPDDIWEEWYALLKKKLTELLGYEIGEPEDGYDFKYFD